MNRGEILIRLLKAFKDNDKDEFQKGFLMLSEFEKSKKNYRLATILEKALIENLGEPSDYSFVASQGLMYMNTAYNQLSITDNESVTVIDPINDMTDIFLTNKEKIEFFLEQWEHSDELKEFNLTPQNSLLFYGPPGTGKTFTAYAISKKLKLKVGYIKFDALISSYLGKTANNMKSVFDFCEKNNLVLLIDEIDAIALSRNNTQDVGELKRIVIALLQNLDEYSKDNIVIACTNHPELLDTAIWRRFDQVVEFNLPSIDERYQIINDSLLNYNIKVKKEWLQAFTICTDGMTPDKIVKIIVNSIREFVIKKDLELELILVRHFLEEAILENISDEEKIDLAIKIKDKTNISYNKLSILFKIPRSTLQKKINNYINN